MAYRTIDGMTVLLVDSAMAAGTDAAINAAFPTTVPGDIILTAGFSVMKQKDLDGSWKSCFEEA